MPRGVKRKTGVSSGITRDGGGRSGTSQSTQDPLYLELDQRMRTLQLPAACSFVFGIIERYVRSLLSHESFSSSLPHKDSLLRLVDTYILKLPSTDKIKNNLPLKWPFNVYEELELLDLLRLQIEERQSMEVQLALFDTMFGLVGREKQCHIEHCMKVLKQLVSLSISMGCTLVLQCVAYWIEIYPVQAMELSKFIYFEFCELLPNAMEPLLGLCLVCPSIAKQFTYHLTSHYHIYTGKHSSLSTVNNSCPPLQLLTLVSHWLSTTPEYIFVQTILIETRDEHFLLRSQKPRTLTPSPLMGLVRWSVMEPLLSDECLISVPSVGHKDDNMVTKLRTEYSKLHADILTSLVSLSSSTNIVNVLSIEDFVSLVNDVMDYIKLVNATEDSVEKTIDRLAQILQAGLSTSIIRNNIDGLTSLVGKVPQNRLMKLVLSRQRNVPRVRDH